MIFLPWILVHTNMQSIRETAGIVTEKGSDSVQAPGMAQFGDMNLTGDLKDQETGQKFHVSFSVTRTGSVPKLDFALAPQKATGKPPSKPSSPEPDSDAQSALQKRPKRDRDPLTDLQAAIVCHGIQNSRPAADG